MPSSPLASLMRQIEVDLRAPLQPMTPQPNASRFDADRYFADGGQVDGAAGASAPAPITELDIQNLYKNTKGIEREADPSGLSYWLDQAKGGMSLDQMQQAFNQAAQDPAQTAVSDTMKSTGAVASFGDNIPKPPTKPLELMNFDFSQYSNPLDAQYAYLSKSLNPTIASAALGNFKTESFNNPSTMQNQKLDASGNVVGNPIFDKNNMPTGYGLAQLGGVRLTNDLKDPKRMGLFDWAQQTGFDPNSTEGQSRFMVYELTNNPLYQKTYNRMIGAGNDLNQVTQIFGDEYEDPANLSKTLAERQAAAQVYHNNYNNPSALSADDQAKIAQNQARMQANDPQFQQYAAKAAAAKAAADRAAQLARTQTSIDPMMDTVSGTNIVQPTGIGNDALSQQLNSNQGTDFSNLGATGLDPYNMSSSFSSSGTPSGQDNGISIMSGMPDWYSGNFAHGGAVNYAAGGRAPAQPDRERGLDRLNRLLSEKPEVDSDTQDWSARRTDYLQSHPGAQIRDRSFARGGPVHMADGGDPPPRTLTIRRNATPQGIAAEYTPPEEQGAASPGWEGIGQGLSAVGQGISDLYSTPPVPDSYMQPPAQPVRRSVTPAMLAASLNPEAQGASSPSFEAMGQVMRDLASDPAGLVGGALPVVGNMLAAADVSKLKDKIAELRASGDEEGATRLQKILPLAAMGAVMPMGAGAATKAAIKGAEKGAVRAIERELSPLGFYSHGAETAAGLQQAKGTPQQYYSMLEKSGVKPAELEGFNEAFAGKPSVTREEIAAHFKERMPQVEETVLGGNGATSINDSAIQNNVSNMKKSGFDPIFDPDGNIAFQDKYGEFHDAGSMKGNQDFKHLYSDAKAIENYLLSGADVKPTKFGQYTLPGGENYREVLLKMPEGYGAPKQALDDLAAAKERANNATKTYTDALADELSGTSKLSPEELNALEKEESIARSRVRNFEKLANRPAFQSGHWQDPNVLAHLRMADRTGPNGEKILHVEEIQSDWGQKGKKEGFKGPSLDNEQAAEYQRLKDLFDAVPDGEMNNQDLSRLIDLGDIRRKSMGIPTAPYVTNTQAWTDLALKRALREAAEGGYDKLVWTPGAEQAKRYSLSNHVDEVQYSPGRNGTHSVEAYKGNNNVFNKPNATIKEIADTFGQEIADKIASGHGEVNRNTGYNVLSGLDLETGGEGMKGYYDKIVPNQLSKLVKKLDPEAKVGRDAIQTQDTPRTMAYFLDWAQARGDNRPRPTLGQVWQNGANEPLVQQFMKETSGLEVPSLTITPKMRESILKGQTAFAEGGEVEAPAQGGQVAFASGGRAVVGHTIAAGEPVSLEEHKGQIRHRQYSGDSKMAADYGYIDNSRKDADGMSVDAYVGPHKDSDRVFIINQQHPHSKRFNEHKVMLGYNHRKDAIHDYTHSFSDGLGHKRIQSIVEMDSRHLKDWIKKNHGKPVHKGD